jgi:hypothetical protein
MGDMSGRLLVAAGFRLPQRRSAGESPPPPMVTVDPFL